MGQSLTLSLQVQKDLHRLITQQTGLVIRDRDSNYFLDKVAVRMKALKLGLLADYYRLLQGQTMASDREWEQLIVLLTNNESYFFRDIEQLKVLENRIFPKLIERTQNRKTLRICSAGCSTGQEPYSLAIMLNEMVPDIERWQLDILGIDIDREALQQAVRGVYEPWSFRGVSEAIKRRYFQKINDRYQLDRNIKEMVRFKPINLVQDKLAESDSELGDLDLILCRNVFIYFEPTAIAQILDKIYHCLKPGGYLMVGHTELAGQDLSKFEKIIFAESLVYRRPCQDSATPHNNGSLISKPQATTSGSIRVPIPQAPLHKLASELPALPSHQILANNRDRQATSARPIQPKRESQKITTDELLDRAERCFEQEKHDLAIELVNQVLAIRPMDFRGCYLLAQLYANFGKYEEAIQYCQRASQIDALATSPYYLLAKIAEEQGNAEEAKQILKRIIYLEPLAVAAYLDLSLIYQQEGDEKRMAKMYATAIDILKQLTPETRIREKGNLTAAELISKL